MQQSNQRLFESKKPLVRKKEQSEVTLGVAHLPTGVRWKHLVGAGFLGGIGFTASIFLANLAFVENVLFDHSKIGILSASMIAAILGWVLLKISTKEGEHQTSTE